MFINKHKILIFVLVTGFLPAALQNSASSAQQGGVIVVGTISPDEAATLQYMREVEKLARDVYLAMYEKWRIPTFSNIASSEQCHMNAIKGRLDAYGLADPALGVGKFTNPELQALYQSLIESGIVSELDAFWVGGLIEEVDIQDLKDALSGTNKTDLVRVYQNLMAASGNHLRAFATHIQSYGLLYTSQYLSQEEVDQILSGSTCKRGCQGGR